MATWITKTVDPRFVKTHSITWTKAYQFAKLMENGAEFPVVKGEMLETGQILVKNGAHRTHAHRLLGRMMVMKVKSERTGKRPGPLLTWVRRWFRLIFGG